MKPSRGRGGGAPRHRGRLRRARAGAGSRGEGRDIIHLEIGEPDFETPASRGRGRHRRHPGGRDALLPDGGPACPARGGSGIASRLARPRDRPRTRSRRERRQAVPVLHRARDLRARATRSSIRIRASRSTSPPCGSPGPTPCRSRSARSAASASIRPSSSSSLTERTRLVILNAPQNPTGGVIPLADLERAAAAIVRTSGLGAHRRGVLADHLRRRGAVDRVAPGPARPHGPPRRLLEDVRHDRLAPRAMPPSPRSSSTRSRG